MTARWAVAASSLAWQDSPADIVVFQSAEQQFDCEQHGYARCSAVNPFSIPAVTAVSSHAELLISAILKMLMVRFGRHLHSGFVRVAGGPKRGRLQIHSKV